MPGPQTQHKGVVYGDDENTPKPKRQPELDPPVRRRPQHTHRRASRSHPPQGLTALRTPDRRNGVRVWGAVHVGTKSRESCPSGSSRAPAYAGPRSRLLPHTPAAGRAEGHAYRPFAARAAGRHCCPQHRCRPPVAEHVVPPAPVLRRRCDAAHRTCPGQADEIA